MNHSHVARSRPHVLVVAALLLVAAPGYPDDASPTDGWAFRPIHRPAVPTPPAEDKARVRTPVDAFVLAKLAANGLRPAPEADRRVLARRVFLDLTGLPPTPDELAAFLADTAPDAYEKLIDRLLASPQYGERWARHWLDVAHYADSHGQDQDRPRPNAWPYRDYVIRSLNADKPYARFVREQVAGDVLSPNDPQALVATGFLAAGPWDESGLRDINADSLDRQVARTLDRDDVVTSVMTTFVGLTVHCARCHDHKFDPIAQDDYYALQAVFAGIDKAERAYDADPAVGRKRTALATDLARVRGLKGKPDPSLLATDLQAEVAAFETKWRAAEGKWVVPEPVAWKSKQGASLKALLDRSVLAVGKRPDKDTYTVTVGADLLPPSPLGGEGLGVRGGLLPEPQTPLPRPLSPKGRGEKEKRPARSEITGLRLEVLCDDTLPHQGPGRQDNGNLHLSEVRVKAHPRGKPDGAAPVKLKLATADFDQDGWGVARAIDSDPTTAWGVYPEVGKPHQAVFEFEKPVGLADGTELTVELDQLHGNGHLIGRFRLAVTSAPIGDTDRPVPTTIAEILTDAPDKRTEAQGAELARWLRERRLERDLASLPSQVKVYCGTNRFTPDGSFKPAATPRPVHVLKRGDITKPGELADPGTVEVAPLSARFKLRDPNDEGQRRAALAEWLTDPANPLVWRVIVNRVWHYHFGRGIVDTPNDFGKMGGTPSHPELLDWLAAEFRDGGGSLKKLHKLILTSSTYRQAVRHDPSAAAKDADNRLLWRMNRGRLDAEAVRDSILSVSGRLDDTMYGPPVKHFAMKPGIHVTPEADYEKFDLDAPEARRRSVYRYVFRTRPDPMLEALDCPDASQSAPVRTVSVGAPQALVLWNNKFTLRHAEHLAALAVKSSAEVGEQVRFVARRVFGRPPTDAESRAWAAYARKHGLPNLCRVLFNSSEFLFID